MDWLSLVDVNVDVACDRVASTWATGHLNMQTSVFFVIFSAFLWLFDR